MMLPCDRVALPVPGLCHHHLMRTMTTFGMAFPTVPRDLPSDTHIGFAYARHWPRLDPVVAQPPAPWTPRAAPRVVGRGTRVRMLPDGAL